MLWLVRLMLLQMLEHIIVRSLLIIIGLDIVWILLLTKCTEGVPIVLFLWTGTILRCILDYVWEAAAN